ncbi:MAG: TonB-dependent receptor [Pseudomonadota bacterium]
MRSQNRVVKTAAGVSLVAIGGLAAADEPIEMRELTVFGGARDERALLDTPNSVSVIDQADVLIRQPSTYEELIGDLPGVTIEGGPRGIAQEPNIRGFRDEQVIIRVDGARQNFDLAHRGRFFTDPGILRRVEVLRGGASTLFGSGALGGVIFLDTQDAADVVDPGELWGGRVTLGYNSQGDEFLGAGTLAFDTGTFDGIAFYSGRPRFSDLEDGRGDPIIDSDIDSQNGLLKLGWEPGGGHRIEASYQNYRDSGNTPPNANVQGTPQTVVDRDLDYQSARLAWEWDAPSSDLIDLSVLAYYNDAEVTEDRFFDGRTDETEFETFGFDAANVSTFDRGLPVSISYGIEVFQDEQDATRDGEARLQAPDAKRRFYAGFVQADVEVLPGLTITPGLRFDAFELEPDREGFDDRSENQLSPRLAASWRPSENAQIFVTASRAFRAPTLTELYNDGVHFATEGFPLGPPGSGAPVFTGVNEFIPSPDLEPERSTQVEIGGRYTLDDVATSGDRVELSGSLYYARVDDFVDTVVGFIDDRTATFNPFTRQLELSGSTENRNVDATLWGFEAEVTYDTGPWFAGVGLTIPRGLNRAGGDLGSIPQDRVVLTGGIRPLDDVELGARATLADGQDDVPEGALGTPGFAVFDLYATWQPQTGLLEGGRFALGIDNLTDRRFRIHPNGLNQPGLAVKLTASWDF